MALTTASTEFLVEAAGMDVSFERTLTIGRQSLRVGPDRIWRLLRRHRVEPGMSRQKFREQLGWSPWSEPFFKLLGATDVQAMDVSDFEGARLVHDLNTPIPSTLHESFDAVFDGGTIEHVFNAAVAMKNYMEMVRVGGRLLIQTHANNYFGHGFYQFSSEFFFRALSEENGYVLERLILCEEDTDALGRFRRRTLYGTHGRRYEVTDPRAAGARVALVTDRPITILVQARRVARRPIFASPPQQSDYASAWQGSSDGGAVVAEGQLEASPSGLGRHVPEPAKRWIIQNLLLRLERDWIQELAPVLDPRRIRRSRRERSLKNRRLFRRLR